METQLREEVLEATVIGKVADGVLKRERAVCVERKTQTKAVSEKEAIKLPYQGKYPKSTHLSVFSTSIALTRLHHISPETISTTC